MFIIVMLNDTPKTFTKQQRLRERNRKKSIEKGKRYYEKYKERLQKIASDHYRGLSEEKKLKKENM